MAVVSHFVFRNVKWTLANPAVCCCFELTPIFICEDHRPSKVEFLISILDVLLENFHEDLSNIFTLAVCPIDDWLLRIKLIIEADDLIAEPTCFVPLIFICGAIITPRLTTTYCFGTSLKVSINHKGHFYWAVMILEFRHTPLIWHLDPDYIISWAILFMKCKLSLLEKWHRHLRQ